MVLPEGPIMVGTLFVHRREQCVVLFPILDWFIIMLSISLDMAYEI